MDKKNIYANFASKYHELGLPVIPLEGKSPKGTSLIGWQKYSDEPLSTYQLDQWTSDLPYNNIGLVLGKQSGVVAFDLDQESPEVLKAYEKCIPKSPVIKKGKKGFTAFYRFQNQQNAKIMDNNRNTVVDFLCDRRQTVLPPSVHPETGTEYTWLTPDTLLDIKVNDLPDINNAHIRAMEKDLYGMAIAPGDGPVMGRNDYLKSYAAHLVARGLDIERIVQELVQEDLNRHPNNPLFSDPREFGSLAGNPMGTALKFYSNILGSINDQRSRRGEKPVGFVELTEVAEPRDPPKAFEYKPLPAPRGIMKLYVDYCQKASKGNVDALALGGAIALMGAFCSNRWRIGNTWSNIYVMNIAPSGTGKGVTQDLAKRCLNEFGLVGAANYKSSTAVVQNLPKQQERLDFFDEGSHILQGMANNQSHQSSLVEYLSMLFSCSSSQFLGDTSAGKGDNKGACYNPCVNVLMSTTPIGFSSSVNRTMAGKGLLPRFLAFYQHDVGEWHPPASQSELEPIERQIKALLKMYALDKPLHRDSAPLGKYFTPGKAPEMGYKYNPFDLIPETAAQDLLTEFDRRTFNERKRDLESFESAFNARFTELVLKLSIIASISEGHDQVAVESVQWAIEVVEAQWHNIQNLYRLGAAENARESSLIRVLEILSKTGSCEHGKLRSLTNWLKTFEFRDIMDSLIDSGRVCEVKMPVGPKGGRPKVVWRTLERD